LSIYFPIATGGFREHNKNKQKPFMGKCRGLQENTTYIMAECMLAKKPKRGLIWRIIMPRIRH